MLPKRTVISEDFHPYWFRNLLFGFLALVAVLHIVMVFKYKLSWDEFFLLEWVYKWNRGELGLVLQTIYFRVFTWLPSVSESEVTQIIAARTVMLGCLNLTCGFIYSICRKFTNVSNAVLSLILFLTMTYVFQNATSFRNDMIVVTFLMGTLWLLMTPVLSWKRVLVSGIMLGLAGMVTIKAIFYVPCVCFILFSHWGFSKWQLSVFIKACTLGIFAILCFAGLYMLHSLSINASTSSADYLSHSINGSLMGAGLFPTRGALYFAVATNILYFSLLLTGLVMSIFKIGKASEKWPYIAAVSFIFPLLTVIFYRHTFPYFYTFMLAPTTVLIAIGLNTPVLKTNSHVMLGLTIALIFKTASISHKSFDQNSDVQKQVLTTIHELFPTPTAYIDRCAMVSSYPKSGLFMSHWMMTDYYKAKQPIMENILATEQPKFILANIDSLDFDKIQDDTGRRLLETDEALLKQNYISHWGPIYVAGKSIQVQADTPQKIRIFIEGPYGIESEYPVNINGKTYKPGDSILLDQKTHIITSAESQHITLRWNSLAIPDTAPPERKLFF